LYRGVRSSLCAVDGVPPARGVIIAPEDCPRGVIGCPRGVATPTCRGGGGGGVARDRTAVGKGRWSPGVTGTRASRGVAGICASDGMPCPLIDGLRGFPGGVLGFPGGVFGRCSLSLASILRSPGHASFPNMRCCMESNPSSSKSSAGGNNDGVMVPDVVTIASVLVTPIGAANRQVECALEYGLTYWPLENVFDVPDFLLCHGFATSRLRGVGRLLG